MKDRLSAKLVLMLVSLLMVFGGLELGLRLAGIGQEDNTAFLTMTETFGRRRRSEYRDDFLLYWSLRPNMSQEVAEGTVVNTNSLGLRSPEIPEAKPAGEKRILCLGDSVTFGMGVEQSLSYPAQLQTLIDRSGPDQTVQVVNGGVVGYSSFQQLNYLQNRGVRLDPDIVTFCTAIGDAGINIYSDAEVLERSNYAVGIRRVLHRLHTYRSMIHLFQAFHEHPIHEERIVSRVPLTDYVANLRQAIQWNRERGASTVLIEFPFRFRHPTPYFKPINITLYVHDYNLAARRLAEEEEGAYFLEVPELRRIHDGRNEHLLYDSLHPTAEGDGFIAGRLHELLVREGLIPEGGTP